MPVREDVDERYWCPGPWPWEWFRSCTRRTNKWCYDFVWVEETRYGLVALLEGCEAGKRYTWVEFPIVGFGSSTGTGRACFDSELSQDGGCDTSQFAPGELGLRLQRQSVVALTGRFRLARLPRIGRRATREGGGCGDAA